MIPQALSGAHSHSANQQQQQQSQRLEDALTYVNQVKFRYAAQPQIFNGFLDIMKELKSQCFDIPNVMTRISYVFQGNPDLILGFNKFLPPGYRLDILEDQQVCVSLPGAQGTTTTFVIQPTSIVASPAHQAANAVPEQPPKGPHYLSSSGSSHQSSSSLHSYHQPPLLASYLPSTPHLPSQPTSAPLQPSEPVEFNHALSYVSKIKHRFQSQPDVYRQFLDIMHTYQKGQLFLREGLYPGTKPLTEAEVYTKVTKLLHNQGDLLQEFERFLPDSTYPDCPLVQAARHHLDRLPHSSTPGSSLSAVVEPQTTSAVPSQHSTVRPQFLLSSFVEDVLPENEQEVIDAARSDRSLFLHECVLSLIAENISIGAELPVSNQW